MLALYILVLAGLSIYSYALVDPNFTLINHSTWEVFRNFMVNLGYYQRNLSFVLYLVLLALLFLFNWYFTKSKIKPIRLAIIISGVLLLSYPFLSHDFFNYLFDAKIFTFYHQNPYIHRPMDFAPDHWLRFMHWTHRTYPYGPSFLVLSLIPSFFSFGKLVLAFLFFKLMFAGFYILGVYGLSKFSNKKALFFATSPLIIIEGLVNNHNDLIAASLGILALYVLYKQKNKFLAGVLAVLSIGIKYITIIFVPLLRKKTVTIILSLLGFFGTVLYMYFKLGIQPWYFLNLAVVLVVVKKFQTGGTILSLGLLLSYYPYIVLGGWDTSYKVVMKEQIIFVTLFTFILSLLIGFFCKNKSFDFFNKLTSGKK